MFQASMRCASTSAMPQARACSRMRGASSARRSEVSFFESSRPTMRRLGLRITAAATTGPNNAPRPASSMPAMRVQPSLRAARSKREEQSRLITRWILARRVTGKSNESYICVSLITKGGDGIDAHGAPGWNVTRENSHGNHYQRYGDEGQRIARSDSVEEVRETREHTGKN